MSMWAASLAHLHGGTDHGNLSKAGAKGMRRLRSERARTMRGLGSPRPRCYQYCLDSCYSPVLIQCAITLTAGQGCPRTCDGTESSSGVLRSVRREQRTALSVRVRFKTQKTVLQSTLSITSFLNLHLCKLPLSTTQSKLKDDVGKHSSEGKGGGGHL